MNDERVKPLEWTEPQQPNDEFSYNHVTAQTPFGRFVITWKGWKEHDNPTIDETPWGDFGGVGCDLMGAKTIAEAEYTKRVVNALQEIRDGRHTVIDTAELERLRADAQRLDALEKLANQPGGVLLHDGSETGRTGLGLRPGRLVRSLRDAIDAAQQEQSNDR
ncbi:hypothetical protein [Algiphilus sp.]|uniref:hypothetical protein n=1 Tax=Algiphilus sp. TaxID=1872431 RepID=UPI003CCBF3F7